MHHCPLCAAAATLRGGGTVPTYRCQGPGRHVFHVCPAHRRLVAGVPPRRGDRGACTCPSRPPAPQYGGGSA